MYVGTYLGLTKKLTRAIIYLFLHAVDRCAVVRGGSVCLFFASSLRITFEQRSRHDARCRRKLHMERVPFHWSYRLPDPSPGEDRLDRGQQRGRKAHEITHQGATHTSRWPSLIRRHLHPIDTDECHLERAVRGGYCPLLLLLEFKLTVALCRLVPTFWRRPFARV